MKAFYATKRLCSVQRLKEKLVLKANSRRALGEKKRLTLLRKFRAQVQLLAYKHTYNLNIGANSILLKKATLTANKVQFIHVNVKVRGSRWRSG